MTNIDIEAAAYHRLERLKELLKSDLRSFDELKDLNSKGVYAIYNGKQLIYIGKTTRRLKDRIREIKGDYRSHTLNNKLLLMKLNKDFRIDIEKLSLKSKEELIKGKKLTEEQFKEAQKEVNKYVKENLKIKFIGLPQEELSSIEHFAISIINPVFND